jgi:CHAT domain-containing protein/Tfp pilus assembly protein PilF
VVKLYQAGAYDQAIPLAKRALAITEARLGPSHLEVATSLNNLAMLYLAKDEYERAEPLYQRALAIREAALGPKHPDVATSLNNLAMLYQEKGEYERAEPLHQRALGIREAALGPNHQDVAASLNNLAMLYQATGEHRRAVPLYQRALEIKEKLLGPDHPGVAASLNNLAELYREQGDYGRAEPLYLRALAIKEKALGPSHLSVAISLNNLAELYRERGEYERAEPLYQRTLSIREQALGTDNQEVAIALHNLAELYREKSDHERAVPLYERALAISEKVLGPIHPDVATSLNNLALLYQSRGEYRRAEPLYQRALAINEQVRGPDHPEVATSLNNLALLYQASGDLERAESLYRRALQAFEKALGPTHPSVATTLSNLAELYREKGNLAQAIALQTQSHEMRERTLALILSSGSEHEKQAYMATLSGETERTVSLHARSAPNDPQALRLALTTVLRRKGRVLDSVTDSIATLRTRFRPEDRTLLDQLALARSQLVTVVFRLPTESETGHDLTQLSRLEAQVRELEAAVSARSAEFRAQSEPVTLEGVQRAIPADAALVELVSYRPFIPEAQKQALNLGNNWGPRRYIAYVLRPQSDPRWTDLGESDAIDKDISHLREALSDPRRTDVKRLAQAMEAKIMRPIRRLLGDTRRVLLSPDGALNLVPFGALVDEDDHYLIERYTFTHVTTGRDLLRLRTQTPSQEGPLIIANPDFDRGSTPIAAQTSGSTKGPSDIRSVLFSNLRFGPLPGTLGEAEALRTLLPEFTILTAAQATEGRIKAVRGPRILHVATHGFFLADRERELGESRLLPYAEGAFALRDQRLENPLLRSGLAFAGANKAQAEDEDGLLTAIEVAGLDLWGTKLVVLSACDTGVGEVRNGEGVYGLRRALVIAGSETQVMSLWKVSDAATRYLMEAYYRRLIAGQGRTEALRQAELEMLGRKGLSHPFFWASFVPSGNWKSLEDQAVRTNSANP